MIKLGVLHGFGNSVLKSPRPHQSYTLITERALKAYEVEVTKAFASGAVGIYNLLLTMFRAQVVQRWIDAGEIPSLYNSHNSTVRAGPSKGLGSAGVTRSRPRSDSSGDNDDEHPHTSRRRRV